MTRKQTESILKLFAITAHSGFSKAYLDAVKTFLEETLAEEYINEYLQLFEQLLKNHESASSLKKISLNSVKLIRYCSEIAKEIDKEDKIYVFTALINFIGIKQNLSIEQYDFIYLVADELEIDRSNAENIIYFSKDTTEKIDQKYLAHFQHYGQQKFSVLKTTGRHLLIRTNSPDIYFNSQKCRSDYIYCADYDTVIKSGSLRQFSYSDLNNLFGTSDGSNSYKLNVKDLSVKIKDKTILHPVNFTAKSGELVAIIGKSGSGKTSLLSSLAGIRAASGEFFISDREKNNYIPESSFVNQDNIFINSFSVEEHLSDRLKFLQIPSQLHEEKISQTLEYTELAEHRHKIASDNNGKTSQLSGGQQKRLNIALSLLQNPELILMDEPSSGLSSAEAYRLFSLLKSLALKNKIVICSVHQPDISIFNMFDKVIVLSPDGRNEFTGKPHEAAEYFKNIDQRVDKQSIYSTDYKPGIILEILEKHQKLEYNSSKDQSPDYVAEDLTEYTSGKTNKRKSQTKQNFLFSLGSYLQREWRGLIKSPIKTTAFLLIPALLAVIITSISRYSSGEEYSYFLNPNIPALIIMILTTAFFVGIISTGHEFIEMRKFIAYENRIIDKRFAYVNSKLIKAFILSILQSAIISIITVYIAEFSSHLFNFFLFVWTMCFIGAISGLLLSSWLSSISIVYLIVPLLVIPQMLFSGALIEFRHFNKLIANERKVPFIASFVPLRWSAEAVMIDLYKNNKYEKDLFITNIHLHEAAYYLNFFIPTVEEILVSEKLRANKIIKTESSKNLNFPYILNNPEQCLEKAKHIFIALRDKALLERDKIFENMYKPNSLRNKYSNQALNDILLSNYRKEKYILKDNEIIRDYALIYKMPDINTCRNHFFSPLKIVFNRFTNSIMYNLIVLSIFISLLITSLYFTHKSKNNL
jgi:ABC transport system ATP-binding/permease protein